MRSTETRVTGRTRTPAAAEDPVVRRHRTPHHRHHTTTSTKDHHTTHEAHTALAQKHTRTHQYNDQNPTGTNGARSLSIGGGRCFPPRFASVQLGRSVQTPFLEPLIQETHLRGADLEALLRMA